MITRLLIIANVLAYLWEIRVAGSGMLSGMGGGNLDAVTAAGALAPVQVLVDHQWWRIITSGFLHGGLIHITLNMVSLWVLGRFVEAIAGPARMFAIYSLSLVASGLGVVYFSAPQVSTLGASGAIFGLFGALFAMGLKLGKPGMQLIRDNIGILVLNLIMTFTIAEISKAAHVAGLIAGFIITLLIYFPPKRVQPVVMDASSGNAYETEYQAPPR
ncbi:MAG TPA: rhomboid family intramembrane serine protease [Candidatus Baltobacteraceae bacterium]|jgi:membrane associated rhomboid family serine protease|nr:rhomboid family intramembrane serine protease [Candidatus Baltobacteraceae bacterium]